MAKQAINVGTAANDKKGDSLRAAFVKVNANFTELYTALGINADGTLNLGAFEFTGSVMSTTDSSAIVIDQAATITSNLSVGGDIVPQTANGGDLGSSTLPWRSLYVSNNTIFIGGVPLGIDANGNLTINGSQIAGGGGVAIPSQTGNANKYLTTNGATLRWDDLSNSIYAGGPGGTRWEFEELSDDNGATYYGRINFPDGTSQYTAWTGSVSSLVNGAKTLSLGSDGALTIPGDIKSNSNINIEINLSDSTLHRWQFGEDGDLRFPSGLQIGGSNGNTEITNTGSLYITNTGLNQLVMEWSAGNNQLPDGADTKTAGIYAGPTGLNIGLTNAQDVSHSWSFDGDGSLKLPGDIRSNSNINIDINIGDSTLRRWQFGEDGSLRLPIGVSIDDNVDPLYPKIIADSGKLFSVQGQGSTGSAALAWSVDPNADTKYAAVGVSQGGGDNLAKVVMTAGNTTATLKVWKLDETGVFTLPAGGVISEGGGISGAIRLTPAGGANANQALLIYPTGTAEGDHIHLTAGGGSTELYLGDDDHYVKLASNGFVVIKTDDGALGGKVWGFAPDGTTSIPGDIKSDSNINIEINLTDSTLRRWQFGEDGDLTFPNGVLKIAGNTISNYVTTEFGASGSQLEVAPTKTVITNGVTNSLSEGGPSLISQALFEVSTNGILSSFQVINTLGEGESTLTGEYLTELDNNSFKIGQRTTNDLGDGSEPLVAFNGWTFGIEEDNFTPAITFPDGTTQTTAAQAFSFSVAADDSTQRAISNNELIKFIGAGGITTASDAEGNITITGSSAGTLSTLSVTGAATAETFNTDQITVVGNRITTTVTNANLELECNGTGSVIVNGGKLILNTGGNAYVESVDYGVNSANSALNIFGGPYQKINLRAGFGTQATLTLATDGTLTLPGSIVGTATQAVFNTTSTTVNAFGAATTALNIGASGAPITGFAATATTSSTASSLGYLGLPQSATAAVSNNTTLVIGDAGKHIYVTTNSQTITIPANASVAYPIGTAITFIAGPSPVVTVSIAITSDTLRLAGGTSTGTRTLAANGMATAVKVAATTWYINGTGLT